MTEISRCIVFCFEMINDQSTLLRVEARTNAYSSPLFSDPSLDSRLVSVSYNYFLLTRLTAYETF